MIVSTSYEKFKLKKIQFCLGEL